MSKRTQGAERWRAILGFEGYYEVSDLGRVRSVDRKVAGCYGTTRVVTGALKEPKPGFGGYVVAELWRENRVRKIRVHTLVLEAFVGPCPPGMECLHGEGGPSDNRLLNLRWGTSSENKYDVVRHGNHHARRREQCPLGHLLVEPNNTPAARSRGHRACLACKRANSNRRYAERMGHAFDLQAKADWHYDRIMSQLAS